MHPANLCFTGAHGDLVGVAGVPHTCQVPLLAYLIVFECVRRRARRRMRCEQAAILGRAASEPLIVLCASDPFISRNRLARLPMGQATSSCPDEVPISTSRHNLKGEHDIEGLFEDRRHCRGSEKMRRQRRRSSAAGDLHKAQLRATADRERINQGERKRRGSLGHDTLMRAESGRKLFNTMQFMDDERAKDDALLDTRIPTPKGSVDALRSKTAPGGFDRFDRFDYRAALRTKTEEAEAAAAAERAEAEAAAAAQTGKQGRELFSAATGASTVLAAERKERGKRGHGERRRKKDKRHHRERKGQGAEVRL